MSDLLNGIAAKLAEAFGLDAATLEKTAADDTDATAGVLADEARSDAETFLRGTKVPLVAELTRQIEREKRLASKGFRVIVPTSPFDQPNSPPPPSATVPASILLSVALTKLESGEVPQYATIVLSAFMLKLCIAALDLYDPETPAGRNRLTSVQANGAHGEAIHLEPLSAFRERSVFALTRCGLSPWAVAEVVHYPERAPAEYLASIPRG